MGADYYSFYVKSIATFALIFFGYIISVLSSAVCQSYSLDHQSQARGQTKASLTWNRASYTAHRETKLCREVLTTIGNRSEKRKRKTSLLNLEFWVNFSVVTYVFFCPLSRTSEKKDGTLKILQYLPIYLLKWIHFFPKKMISFLQWIIFEQISYSEWPLRGNR